VRPETISLLSDLYDNREAISRKLDESSRESLLKCIQNSVHSGQIDKDFIPLCKAQLKEFVDLKKYSADERLGSKDQGKLTPPPADVEKFTNELVKVLKQPKPEVKPSEDKKK